MPTTDIKTCVICDKPIDVQRFENGGTWAGGHNAEPIAEGRCCTACNTDVVLPARLRQHYFAKGKRS